MDASLVMRDRETDSWWSIMTSTAIGGAMDGAELEELPVGEKTTWKEWVGRHPETWVLSVEGREHEPRDPYRDYFTSDRTFRGLEVEDRRLEAKEPIYSFWLGGEPYAVPHTAFAGGKLFAVEAPAGKSLLLYRRPEAPMFESTRAFLVDRAAAEEVKSPQELLARLEADADAEKVAGFDTFWYNWIAVNKSSKLLR